MSFETISFLLSWMEMGALLAILFRLSRAFNLIANTQRELRRAIHHLGECRTADRGFPLARASAETTIGADDLPYLPF
jgi:hypothetical protein